MFHFSGRGFMPDVPTQIRESMQIDQRTHTTYADDYDPPKKSKKSRVEEEVQDNKSREEEVKDNTHVQKVSRRTSARILKGKQNISDSTHDLKQQRKRGAILVEDEAVVKDQIPLNKKKKIVAEVKPQEAVPDEKDHVGDDSGQEDDDDFLDDIMPMTNKCNLDIVFKELEKDPKFEDVRKWLKGIEDDSILSTVEPVVQANVPGFVSTEAVGKLGAGSKLSANEFVPPESIGKSSIWLLKDCWVVQATWIVFGLKVWEILERVASYLNLFPLKVWEIFERVRGYLDLFGLKVWEMLERVASYLNLFPFKLWDILERVPSYLDLVPHSD